MVPHRFVAMLDILGFQHMVRTLSVTEMVRRVEKLFEIVATYHTQWAVGYEVGKASVGHVQFSDTILIWTPPVDNCSVGREMMEITNLLKTTCIILLHGFLNGMPLRAGVASGECYINEATQTYVGQAIVDAYLAESQQEWIGGGLHPVCHERLDYLASDLERRALVERDLIRYSVPVKPASNVRLDYALDWTRPAQASLRVQKSQFGVSLRGLLRRSLREYLRLSATEQIQMKYNNTAVFINTSLELGINPDHS